MGKSDSATTRNDGGIDPAALAVASLAAAVSVIAPPGPYGPASMMIGATILVVIFAYDVAPRRTLSQSIAFGGVCALMSLLALVSNTPSPPIKRKDSVRCSRSCRKARTSVTPRSRLGRSHAVGDYDRGLFVDRSATRWQTAVAKLSDGGVLFQQHRGGRDEDFVVLFPATAVHGRRRDGAMGETARPSSPNPAGRQAESVRARAEGE